MWQILRLNEDREKKIFLFHARYGTRGRTNMAIWIQTFPNGFADDPTLAVGDVSPTRLKSFEDNVADFMYLRARDGIISNAIPLLRADHLIRDLRWRNSTPVEQFRTCSSWEPLLVSGHMISGVSNLSIICSRTLSDRMWVTASRVCDLSMHRSDFSASKDRIASVD